MRELSALLEQGRVLHLTALALALAALALGPPVLGAIALLLAGLETWLAIRVGLDARLFRDLADEAARGPLDLAAFDASMVNAGLLPALPPQRPVEARLAGGLRLFQLQALLTAAELALALLSLAL